MTDGIRKVHEAFRQGRIRIGPDCRDTLREFSLYRWEEGSSKDTVKKENDHAMDDMRYFVSTVLGRKQGGVAAWAVERKG